MTKIAFDSVQKEAIHTALMVLDPAQNGRPHAMEVLQTANAITTDAINPYPLPSFEAIKARLVNVARRDKNHSN